MYLSFERGGSPACWNSQYGGNINKRPARAEIFKPRSQNSVSPPSAPVETSSTPPTFLQIQEQQAAAMQLSDAELANRIIKLNTLAHLRSQLALRQEWEAQHVTVSSALPTKDQVASYEALIDF